MINIKNDISDLYIQILNEWKQIREMKINKIMSSFLKSVYPDYNKLINDMNEDITIYVCGTCILNTKYKYYNYVYPKLREWFKKSNLKKELIKNVWHPKNWAKFKYLNPDTFDDEL